jgi:hypothetical protein
VQTLGNGIVLDRRNRSDTHISRAGAGYDLNRRSVVERWRNASGGRVTGYASTCNATNVVPTELREHLARADKYTLDSLSRRVAFDHNAPSATAPAVASRLSTWQLDGVHSRQAYTRRGESLAPVVDLAGGVKEYQSFGGAVQLHDANGSRIQYGRHLYTYDFASRLVAVADSLLDASGTANRVEVGAVTADSSRLRRGGLIERCAGRAVFTTRGLHRALGARLMAGLPSGFVEGAAPLSSKCTDTRSRTWASASWRASSGRRPRRAQTSGTERADPDVREQEPRSASGRCA